MSIPQEYFEAARDRRRQGAGRSFRQIILPLARPATVTVIILSLIGGLRSFDLIWAMTRGGPGFTSDVIARSSTSSTRPASTACRPPATSSCSSLVTAIILPLSRFLNRKEVDL